MTRDEVRARLAARGLPIGSRGGGSPAVGSHPPARSDFDLNPNGRPSFANGRRLKPAGVLVPLVARPEGPTVLLTQRTDHLAKHAGQISFPGGGMEPGDPHLEETALRETEEEIGLHRRHVEVLGQLDIYETSTAYGVAPFVAWVRPPFALTVDAFEVADVFEVPLTFILDRRNHTRESRVRDGIRRHFYVLPFEQRYIWGATAGMLVNLADVLSD